MKRIRGEGTSREESRDSARERDVERTSETQRGIWAIKEGAHRGINRAIVKETPQGNPRKGAKRGGQTCIW
jgi:hypothetical protein